MNAGKRRGPVKSYTDPRIEIYEPTTANRYYLVVAYDARGRRVVNTTGGTTLRSAQDKAARIAKHVRRGYRRHDPDPGRALAHAEAELWLDPNNHRMRDNRPWSPRHAENMMREWRLRISPHVPPRTTVEELANKQVWIRILNEAQASGCSAGTVQKTGQACRSFVSWLMDRDLLETNPMRGVRYTLTKAHNDGLDPRAVRVDEVPNLDMVYDLALWMSWLAWRARPGTGGNRRADVVGPEGRGLQPMLVATTGIRNGELFALRAGHVSLGDLEIKIEQQLVEPDHGARYLDVPKHGSIRTVTFAAFLQHDPQGAHRKAPRAVRGGRPYPVLRP